ncbi:MAG TPA: ComF family protein [Syntrophorhabdus sp.]|nr:ComF family protein [Syntrophorhabdus sp.]
MNLICPLRCGGCNVHGHTLCPQCIDSFLVVDEETSCPICGMPVGIRKACGRCIAEKNMFAEGLYGFYYENRLRDAMHAFKFSGRKDVGRCLVGLVEEKISAFSDKFDCIIPIPVTEKRLRERGFNQSFILAEEIARMTGRPVLHSMLRKTKETKDQYTLSREERRKNIKGAFSLTGNTSLKGKMVLLVDDLYTTGQTSREAARILYQGKAQSVVLFALARTP